MVRPQTGGGKRKGPGTKSTWAFQNGLFRRELPAARAVNFLFELLERLRPLDEHAIDYEGRSRLNSQRFGFAAALVDDGLVFLAVKALVELLFVSRRALFERFATLTNVLSHRQLTSLVITHRYSTIRNNNWFTNRNYWATFLSK